LTNAHEQKRTTIQQGNDHFTLPREYCRATRLNPGAASLHGPGEPSNHTLVE
jgi:hypothetical protein